MTLRYQHDDEVDCTVKRKAHVRGTVSLVCGLAAFFLVVDAIDAFISGKSLAAFRSDAAWEVAGVIVIACVIAPLSRVFGEHRMRSKEILGRVSGIEASLSAVAEKLAAIEEKIDVREHARS